MRAVFNDVADKIANEARIAAASCRYPPRALAGEVKVGMWLPNLRGPGCGAAVIGSFRRAMLRQAEKRNLQSLAKKGHQGRLARECGPQLITAFRAARKSRDPQLLRFFVEAAVEYLPTERRLMVRRTDMGRGEACKLCGATKDTCLHALGQCTHMGVAQRRRLVVRAAAALHRAQNSNGVITTPAYFDPSSDGLRVGVNGGAQLQGPNQRDLERHPPLGGLIGITPQRVGEMLRRPGDDLAATQARAGELSMVLMWGALSIWTTRCTAMNALLNSSENGYASGLVTQMVQRKRKAAKKKEEKKRKKFAERMSAKAARREAKRDGTRKIPGERSVAVDRPRRSLLERTPKVRFGDYVSRPSLEEERQETRSHLLREGVARFPDY
jgi:hypothetical protein